MNYLNQFHKDATERKILITNELRKLPINSVDAANDMRWNLEIAKSLIINRS